MSSEQPSAETDPLEIEHSQRILALLERVDQLNAALQNHLDVAAGSRLTFDDERLPNFPVSSYGYAQLSAALGCLQSLGRMAIRETEDTVTMTLGPYGAYALVRNALDCAATALWMLEPVNSTLRVKRRLLLGVEEVQNWAAFRRSVDWPWAAWKTNKRARLKAVADLAGLGAWNPLKAELPSMTSILSGLEHRHQEATLPWLSAWQLASGHAHGKLWSNVVSHNLDALEGTRTATGATYRVTIKYGMLHVLLYESVQLIDVAAQRYVELAER